MLQCQQQQVVAFFPVLVSQLNFFWYSVFCVVFLSFHCHMLKEKKGQRSSCTIYIAGFELKENKSKMEQNQVKHSVHIRCTKTNKFSLTTTSLHYVVLQPPIEWVHQNDMQIASYWTIQHFNSQNTRPQNRMFYHIRHICAFHLFISNERI